MGVYDGQMNRAKEKLLRRLNIVEGQIRGLMEMVKKDTYCINIITQTSAAKQAISGIEDMLMQNHLSTCVVHQMKRGKETKAIGEILKVYRLKRK